MTAAAVRCSVIAAVAATRVVSAAQNGAQASESDVKAAYLYQFSKYVEWPAASVGSADAITMCVLCDTGVAGARPGRTS